MFFRLFAVIASGIALAGCVTVGESTPVRISAEEEIALRRWMAIQINGSVAAYGVVAPPAVSKATITGPEESKDIFGQGTRYCVYAELDTILISTPVSATVVLRQEDGKVKRDFSVSRNSSGCARADAKPFPELIEERAKLREKLSVGAAPSSNRP
jgi:hypothetical protein